MLPRKAVITGGPMSSSPSATASPKAAMARIVTRIARWNSSRALAGLEAGQVGEDRGLDGLEELQRRAHDQHHVEHEAGQPAVSEPPPRLAATISTPAFISVCSESMIPTTATAKPAP